MSHDSHAEAPLSKSVAGGFGGFGVIAAKIGHRKILKTSLIDRGENSESIPHGPGSGKNQKYFSEILDFENPKGGVREVAAAPAKFQLKKW